MRIINRLWENICLYLAVLILLWGIKPWRKPESEDGYDMWDL